MSDTTNTPAPIPAPRRFLRIRDVMSRTGLSKSTVYAKIRLKQFPAHVPLGSISVWVESEIDEWMEEQVAARDKAA
ncbi:MULTISPECIES: helix-turn-helix transcriptional regulator [Xanthomonas]|uniref:helix-turn-helix transcriptional regulator n=1 Tax=Xanthomonas TaxID=338 RepID=UPI001ADC26E3|nr:AlpA family transcriptional regulator [Xanthomonas phaseoli]MBO9766466.1 AlpA family transcriptional regulator [Xanthomonas phaseoli pv. dieffenbachiae]MBO9776189.1 AlpA family transcriptional regulator [Xanthomonas phaseoli pv. dieffenbachiae]MBO9778212.1 AlpA family transcriptional regulator [Xanthomonas phaseoli pv. dieffenbachiae]MBO9795399.1 AlpA family transcriptional regulator [Xanthomonas phaseoli pv. dieffenbachiae]MBO9801406.1 AlpA family transcriptional regulator [Xanthomonas pha